MASVKTLSVLCTLVVVGDRWSGPFTCALGLIEVNGTSGAFRVTWKLSYLDRTLLELSDVYAKSLWSNNISLSCTIQGKANVAEIFLVILTQCSIFQLIRRTFDHKLYLSNRKLSLFACYGRQGCHDPKGLSQKILNNK